MPKRFRDMPDWAANRKVREDVKRDERGEEWDELEREAAANVRSIPPDEQFRDPNTPTNEQRARRANVALRAYAQEVGVDTAEATIQDLINDLAHWCDRHFVAELDERTSMAEMIESAARSYGEETDGKGGQFDAK